MDRELPQTYKRGQFIYYNSEIDIHEKERIKLCIKGVEKRFKKGEISKTKKEELINMLDSQYKQLNK